MGSFTDAVEVDLLKLCVGKATTIFTTTVITPYIALYTTAPSDSSAGTEVSGSSYARVNAPSASWPNPTSGAGSVANTTAVAFATVTTSGYTLLGCALCDASSAGNLILWASISSLALAVGDNANFAIGAITFTLD